MTDPALKNFFTKEFGLRTVCTTNLTVESMLLGLLDDQESRSVTIGATTTAFVTVPVSLRDVGRSLNRIRPPEGDLLYGRIAGRHHRGTCGGAHAGAGRGRPDHLRPHCGLRHKAARKRNRI